MTKQKLDIEKLLSWAYIDELPKQNTASNGLLADLAMLGGLIDCGDNSGKMPVNVGPPHPDALMIDYYVRGLPHVRVDWKTQRDHLMGSLSAFLNTSDPIVAGLATGPVASVREFPKGKGDNTSLRASARAHKPKPKPRAESAAALIVMHARLRNRPFWDIGTPRIVPKRGQNNQPLMDGRLIRKNFYTTGSVCPLTLEPPAQEIAAARFEYMVWHQALCSLVDDIKTALHEFIPLRPLAPAQPWVTGEEPEKKPRVHHTDPNARYTKLPLNPPRPQAAPPLRGDENPATTEDRERWLKELTTTDNRG